MSHARSHSQRMPVLVSLHLCTGFTIHQMDFISSHSIYSLPPVPTWQINRPQRTSCPSLPPSPLPPSPPGPPLLLPWMPATAMRARGPGGSSGDGGFPCRRFGSFPTWPPVTTSKHTSPVTGLPCLKPLRGSPLLLNSYLKWLMRP